MFFRRKKKGAGGEGTGDRGGGTEDSSAALDPASTQFLTGKANADRRIVQVLLDIIARVSKSEDLDAVLTDIVDHSIEITGAERGLLVLKGEGDEALRVHVARQRGKKTVAGDLRFSTSVARRVLQDNQPIRATVHSDSEALELGRSVFDLKLRAVMCVPLTSANQGEEAKTPGVLYVDSRAATRTFEQRDLELFHALAQNISIAMENARLHFDSLEKVRLEQSLELASAIQRDLMPEIPRDLPGWDLHGWYGPAEGTAGDFYDFIRRPGGGVAIVVADVTGHGIGPALITASAQASLRTYMKLLEDPARILTELNADVCERVEDGRFLTLFLAELTPGGQVTAINAGHALPMLRRAQDGEILTLERGGPALGMVPGETYRPLEPLEMGEGDVLVIYTDGLIEARDPDDPERFFGEDGLRRALSEAAGGDARSIALELVERALSLSHGLREDDITLVVAKRVASPPNG